MEIDLTNLVAQVIIAMVAALGGGLLALFVKGKKVVKQEVDELVPEEWHWALEQAARIAVKAAEQMFDAEANGKKLDWAIQYVFDYMAKVGIELSEADQVLIQGAIEKAVYELKQEWHKLPDDL